MREQFNAPNIQCVVVAINSGTRQRKHNMCSFHCHNKKAISILFKKYEKLILGGIYSMTLYSK